MRCSRSAKVYRPLIAAALFLGAAGSLQAKPHAKHAARDQVIALENQWVKAQIQGDVTFMDRLLSPDFLGITSGGDVETKAQQLEHMRDHSFEIKALEISDVRVKLLGQHAASVTSLAQIDGTRDGHPLRGSFRYTHVYQRLPGGMWTITNFEATRIQNHAGHGNPAETSGDAAPTPAPK